MSQFVRVDKYWFNCDRILAAVRSENHLTVHGPGGERIELSGKQAESLWTWLTAHAVEIALLEPKKEQPLV